MIQQTVLPFKLEKTDDLITAQAGLVLWGEFAAGLGLSRWLDHKLPGPGSSVGYLASEYVYPLMLMITGGGRSLEDLRQIRKDRGLREVLSLKKVPSSDAVGDWLRRSGANGGLEGLAGVNRKVLKRGLKAEKIKGYTLDIDATGIEADKRSAMMTYKGYKGYMPIIGHLAENGLVVADEFRKGNDAPASRNLAFVKYCRAQMPKGKHIKALRADSATYQSKAINYCRQKGITFAIGARLDQAVVRSIESLGDADWRDYQNGSIAETVHCMNKSNESFRLIIIRRPCQRTLFNESKEITERYTVIATDRMESAEEVVRWYNQRGECSENRIKGLKIGFGMERMPCGQFEANAVYFRIGVLAYNVGRLCVLRALGVSWHRHQVQTLRWRLYGTAGKIVFHGRSTWLKINKHLRDLFSKIRLKSWEFANS